jgi:zinc transport system substrate-binding protein
VRREGVTTIFTEELVSSKVASALAREAGGVRTETLNPLEGLTEREQRRGDDWASVRRANLVKLSAALGCTAPR